MESKVFKGGGHYLKKVSNYVIGKEVVGRLTVLSNSTPPFNREHF